MVEVARGSDKGDRKRCGAEVDRSANLPAAPIEDLTQQRKVTRRGVLVVDGQVLTASLPTIRCRNTGARGKVAFKLIVPPLTSCPVGLTWR